MNKLKSVIIFLTGIAAGSVGTWVVLKEVYAARAEEDISSVKEAFHAREKKLNDEIKELDALLKERDEAACFIKEEELPAEIREAYRRYGAEKEAENTEQTNSGDGIMQYAESRYHKLRRHSDTNPKKADTSEDATKNDVEQPYVISPDDFGELDGYTSVGLIYYSDGVLADEYGIPVDDIEEIVGDALNHFGEYSDDNVWCRSDVKRCDYEIARDLRNYADVRKNLPRNL